MSFRQRSWMVLKVLEKSIKGILTAPLLSVKVCEGTVHKIQHSILSLHPPLIAERQWVLGWLHLRCHDGQDQPLQCLHQMRGEGDKV